MKNKIERQSKKESSTSRRPLKESDGSRSTTHILGNGLFEADTDICIQVADIMEAFPCYVMLVDEDHHILRGNAAVQKGLGLNPTTIVGQYCPEAVHGLKEPWHACPLEESAEKLEPVEREAFDPASGSWIRSSIYPTQGRTEKGKRIFFHMVSDITGVKETQQQLKTSREQVLALSRYLESVREEERTNLAREIHDELGHILTSLKIDLSWLNKRVSHEQTEKIKSMLDLIDGAILATKRISTELRPGVLDDLGLSAAIEWQSQEFERLTSIRSEFKSSPANILVDRERSTAIFRICQEALTNVARHSRATKVQLILKRYRSNIALTIRDNGDGIDEKQVFAPKSFGLMGMRERVHYWGGEVKVSGSPGKGTVVSAVIPLSKREDIDVKNTDSR
jgi:PAS domain S-box-containing protein